METYKLGGEGIFNQHGRAIEIWEREPGRFYRNEYATAKSWKINKNSSDKERKGILGKGNSMYKCKEMKKTQLVSGNASHLVITQYKVMRSRGKEVDGS